MMRSEETTLWCRLFGHDFVEQNMSRVRVGLGQRDDPRTYTVLVCARTGCECLAPGERTDNTHEDASDGSDDGRTYGTKSGSYR